MICEEIEDYDSITPLSVYRPYEAGSIVVVVVKIDFYGQDVLFPA